MFTIYKYPLRQPKGIPEKLFLPKGAEVLSVGIQDQTPMLWAKVDTHESDAPRHFYIAATGEDLREIAHWRFLGHLRFPGPLEFFVFEEPEQ